MNSDAEMFRRYWKRFLPVWLWPVSFMATVLVQDFGGRSLLHGLVIGLSTVWFFASYFWSLGPYVRGELKFGEVFALQLPFLGVWVGLVLLRAAVFVGLRPL